jgi:hypothetical protein
LTYPDSLCYVRGSATHVKYESLACNSIEVNLIWQPVVTYFTNA